MTWQPWMALAIIELILLGAVCVGWIRAAAVLVSEKKKTEKAAQDVRQQISASWDLLPQPIFECDLQGKITFLNQPAFNLFGYAPGDIGRGLTLQHLFSKKEQDRILQTLLYYTKSEGHNFSAACKNGTTFPVMIYSTLVKEDGCFSGLRGIIIDTSEQQRSENALRQSENRFHTVIESSGQLIYDCDLNSGVILWTGAIELVFGVPNSDPVEISLQDWQSRIHPMDRSMVKQAFEKAAQTGEPFHLEYRLNQFNNTCAYVEEKGVYFKDEHGLPFRKIGSIQEINQRKSTEETLRSNEEKSRTLIEQMVEGLFLIDENMTICEINAAFEQITGFKRQNTIGKPFKLIQDVLLPISRHELEYKDAYQIMIHDALQTGTSSLFNQASEISFFSQNGKTTHAQLELFPVKTSNGYRIGGILRDITEHKQSQMVLQRFAARTKILQGIERAILAASSPEEIASAALEGIQQIISVMRAEVIVVDAATQRLTSLAKRGRNSYSTNPETHYRSLYERIQNGQPIILSDITSSPQQQAICSKCVLSGVHSLICFPLLFNGKMVGMFKMCSSNENLTSKESLEIASEVADQLAIAIQHSLLNAEAQKRIQELTHLHQISQTLNQYHDVKELSNAMARQIAVLVEARGCIFLIRDEKGALQTQMPALGLTETQLELFHSSQQYRQNNYPIAVEDFDPLAQRLGVESLFAVPFIHNQQYLGTVIVFNKSGGFHKNDIRLLTIFASQVAAVIAHANLVNRLSQSLDHEKSLKDVLSTGKIIEKNPGAALPRRWKNNS
jgi:PAS domain S-box-containing protein